MADGSGRTMACWLTWAMRVILASARCASRCARWAASHAFLVRAWARWTWASTRRVRSSACRVEAYASRVRA